MKANRFGASQLTPTQNFRRLYYSEQLLHPEYFYKQLETL
jgi:hypothetical protein